jgi:hypothetical protein
MKGEQAGQINNTVNIIGQTVTATATASLQLTVQP